MFGQTDLCLDRQTHVQTDNLKKRYSDIPNKNDDCDDPYPKKARYFLCWYGIFEFSQISYQQRKNLSFVGLIIRLAQCFVSE